MPGQRLVTTQEFVAMAKMDPTLFYLLFETKKLPVIKRKETTYIDINDVRAKKYMPGYEPVDLFK